MFAFAVVLIAADLAPPPMAEPGFVLRRPTADPVVRLLQQDRVDEALGLLDENVRQPSFFAYLAQKAAAGGNDDDALCLYEAHLRHNPFADRYGDPVGWAKAAGAYLDLLARTENPSAEWFRQSRAAAADYAALAGTADADAAARLAGRIIAVYPRSVYAVPAAVLAAGRTQNDVDRWRRAVDFGRRLAASGVGPADRLPLRRLEFGDAVSEAEGLEIATLARSPLERRAGWRVVLESRAQAGNWDAARAAGAAFVACFDPPVRPRARAWMLRAYGSAGLPEAERWVAGWRKAGEPFDARGALAHVADLLANAGRPADAIARYEEALAAKGDDADWTTDSARLALAKLYADKGDDPRRVALLTQAAAASDQSSANRLLGWHFADKGEHARAIKYLERWTPSSGCGTCHDQMEAGRKAKIAECRAALTKLAGP